MNNIAEKWALLILITEIIAKMVNLERIIG